MTIFKKLGAALALSLSLSAPASAQFSGNPLPSLNSTVIDAFACSNIGSVLTRNTIGWTCTTPGTAGQVLKSNGAGSNPGWYTPTGTGTVTSVDATVPAFMAISGNPITAGGTLAFSFPSQAANLLFASPSGSAGAPTFRAMTSLDLPAFGSGDVSCAAGGASCTVAALAITGAKMANATITTSQISATAGIIGGQIAASTITNAKLANMNAVTIKGNPTNAAAAPADFTIQGLTDVGAPNAILDWLPIYDAGTGTIMKVNASELQTAVGGGVSSFNSRAGAVVPATGDYTTQQIATISNGSVSASGRIGEMISAFSNAATPGNSSSVNVSSVSLTAGNWACSGNGGTIVNASNVLRDINMSISLVSGVSSSAGALGYSQLSGLNASNGQFIYLGTGTIFYNFSAPTNVYLVGSYFAPTYTGGQNLSGTLACFRIT